MLIGLLVAVWLGVVLFYFWSVFGLINWYKQLYYTNKKQKSWMPLVLMIIFAALIGLITPLTWLIGVGPGFWLWLAAIPTAFIAFVFYILSMRKEGSKAKISPSQFRLFHHIVALACVLALTLSPMYGSNFITKFCDHMNAQTAQPIIIALNEYKADTGAYPNTLAILTPQYIENLPSAFCFHPVFRDKQFHYEMCADHSHLLWVSSVVGGFPQRYHFETERWSSISFLDGLCSYLD